MISTSEIFIRLALSITLSGIIGLERESIKRPAGLRTHILVCVGSTLVMLMSLFLFETYKGQTTLQPDRLGAQVISGIGFLGAGTIIREGSSVKGLTTAAGLWAIATIGLAVGSGFYSGAILATILVFLTLRIFSKFEKYIKTKRNYVSIKITSLNKPGQLGKIGQILGRMNISIDSIDLEETEEDVIIINLLVKIPNMTIRFDLINELRKEDGIIEVSQKM